MPSTSRFSTLFSSYYFENIIYIIVFTNRHIFRVVIGFLCLKLQIGVKIRKTKYYSDNKLTSLAQFEEKNVQYNVV